MSGPASVRFTEEMKGFVGFAEQDFRRGYQEGSRLGDELMFHLTIEVDDIVSFVADRRHAARAGGWVRCEALGGRLWVEDGVFNLFVDDGEQSKRMLYRLMLQDGVGHPLTLSGHKLIRTGGGLDIWPDTSTLYTRVLRGHVMPEEEPDAELVAAGILRILKRDFARQLTTFRAGGGSSTRDRLGALARFNALFARELLGVYGDPQMLLRRRPG